MILLLLAACARPPGMEGCASLSGNAREDCRFEVARGLVSDPPALDVALGSIEDATARDLVRVRLAFEVPTASSALCAKVVTPVGKQRCQQIIGRPHLRGSP